MCEKSTALPPSVRDQLVEKNRVLDIVERDGSRADQEAAVIGSHAQTVQRLYDLGGDGFGVGLELPKDFQRVNDFDIAFVVRCLVGHEGVHALQQNRIGFDAVVGALQRVVAHRARGHDARSIGLLDADHITDRRQLAHRVVFGEGQDGPAAVPAIELFDLYAEVLHRIEERLFEVAGVVLHGAAGVIAQLHVCSQLS